MTTHWSASEIATATNGTTTGAWTATSVSIDTRTMEQGALFVALPGENGEPARGTVIRWDQGVDADATFLGYWQAPHCADDECGKPCGHESPS